MKKSIYSDNDGVKCSSSFISNKYMLHIFYNLTRHKLLQYSNIIYNTIQLCMVCIKGIYAFLTLGNNYNYS